MTKISRDPASGEKSEQVSDLIQFEGISNCRDIGCTINRFLNRIVLKEGVLYRSGRLAAATPEDVDFLFTTLRISTILDLRTTTEHTRRSSCVSSWPAQSQTAKSPCPSIHEIPFLSSKFNHKLLLSLSWYNIIFFLILLAIGQRYRAIGIITRTVMQPMGLEGVAKRSLLYCGSEIHDIIGHVTEDSAPLLIHCTQGKDRTGLAVLLILMLVLENEIEAEQAVEYDYMLSNDGLKEIRGEMLDEMRAMGFTDDSGFADAPNGWVNSVLRFIEQNWGGVRGYLKHIGVADNEMENVRAALLTS